jgi:hypothetical protein
MLRTISLFFALCLAATTLLAPGADAQPKQAAPKPNLTKLAKELESGDEARVLAALEQAGDAGKPAAPLIDKLLQRGSNAKIAVRAIEVAGLLEQPASSGVLAPYVQHRASDVRHAAARALIKTRGAKAIAALRKALRSSDPLVRGIAANGLGSMGAKEAIPDLLTALDHNVVGASEAIGQLCAVKQCETLTARLGKLPLDVLTSGLDQILFRPSAEIPDAHKLAIVGRLRELGTKDAGKYLSDVAGRWPENWSKQVKQALDSAVKASGVTAKEEQ